MELTPASNCQDYLRPRCSSYPLTINMGLMAVMVVVCLGTGMAPSHELLEFMKWPSEPARAEQLPGSLREVGLSANHLRLSNETSERKQENGTWSPVTRQTNASEPVYSALDAARNDTSSAVPTLPPAETRQQGQKRGGKEGNPSARKTQQSFRKTEFHPYDADHSPILPSQRANRWKKYVAICATSRDDYEEDLQEWIEYHLRIGVDVIYLVDHHSVVPKFSSLLKYVRTSQLVYHFLETPIADQMYVYEFCVHTYGPRHRWMGFIDTDEFVVIPSGKPIQQILKDYEAYPGLSINWRYIGSSGQKRRPAKGVLATYSNCGIRGDKHVKTFANPAQILQITNAHYQHYVHNARAVNVRKKELDGPFNSPPLMETMFINHYFLKSEEDWKVKQGRWKGWHKKFPNRTALDASLKDKCSLLQMPGPPRQPQTRLKPMKRGS